MSTKARVSQERVAKYLATPSFGGTTVTKRDLCLDIQDCHAELAKANKAIDEHIPVCVGLVNDLKSELTTAQAEIDRLRTAIQKCADAGKVAAMGVAVGKLSAELKEAGE